MLIFYGFLERKASNQIFDTLLILTFLTLGQIIRGLATRKFLSNYAPLRHRFIFGLNGFGSLVNILIPLRAGDILRLLFLSKKKLGLAVSTYFILVERVIDLFIANIVFFAFGYFREDLKFSTNNYIGWLIGTLGLMLLFFGTRHSHFSLSFRRLFSPLDDFRLVFSRRELALFCLSLAGSWGFTSLAFLILGKRSLGLVQEWVSLNSNFTDPLSLALSVYNIFFLTLIIPLILAYLYSLSIPSSAKISRITTNEFLKDQQSILEITPFESKYAGSGSDLYLAKTIDTNSKRVTKYMVRVEHSRVNDTDTTKFLEQAQLQYKFPKVHYTKVFMNARCTIFEFIVDSESGAPSRNAFERMSTGSDSLSVLDDVVNHVFEFHSEDSHSSRRAVDEDLIQGIKSRITRTSAFVCLTLNYFNSEDRKRIAKFSEVTNKLVKDSDRLKSRFSQGACHGDASLSNFLVQEVDARTIIRSIDPNTRFPVSNIEFDLAKVMQSTHALYEFSLRDTNMFPNNKIDFLRFQEHLGWGSRLMENISGVTKLNGLDLELLRFFLLLHLIRIVPYKVHSGRESLRQFLDLVDWVDELVNF